MRYPSVCSVTDHSKDQPILRAAELLVALTVAGVLTGCANSTPSTAGATSPTGVSLRPTSTAPTTSMAPKTITPTTSVSPATSRPATPSVTATARPTAADPANPATWIVEPAGVGPFRVGGKASALVKAGLVQASAEDLCGTKYEPSARVERTPGGIDLEFRDGSPEDLDFISVDASQVRTAKGIGVGSSRTDVIAAYGKVPQVRVSEGPAYSEALFDGSGHGLAIFYEGTTAATAGTVTGFETVTGSSPTNLRHGWWEC